MEAISTRAIDTQDRENARQSSQPALNIPSEQPTEKPVRGSNIHPLFTSVNTDKWAHHLPSTAGF